MQYWLVKQEPEKYAWTQFVADKGTYWDGVRNYQARNNLRAMGKGDLVLYYHSVSEKAVVGVAKVTREAYPDPTAKEGDWSVVDLKPEKELKLLEERMEKATKMEPKSDQGRPRRPKVDLQSIKRRQERQDIKNIRI